ncbi:e3 ubiquitin-protein ligase ubr3 [Caerostris extrusa]|uniref:E3 ubiquitin-protein ligase n=1 Tax=Caerostris extrusa TaxID=172846 RepID=A0AAV4XTG4_CAEEX|nr:e3 ubiquitin-protein ligase ubr3 [Caerostris extrusa]
MAKEAAEVLIKKGKRATAAYIQGVCSSQSNTDVTNEVFDSILNPLAPINSWNGIDWCRWLLAGGKAPEDYTQTVRRYDNATTCGLVWTANFVAYRCRTCGISPCMSLCSECFQKVITKAMILTCFAVRLVEPVIVETKVFSDSHDTAMHFADNFLSLLQSHSEMGAAMRSVMTQALTNPQIYYMLAADCESGNNLQYRRENLNQYLDARNSLGPTEEDEDISSDEERTWFAADQLKDSTFLEELVFWTIKFEFPQKLVCLLLSMMPDLTYKEAFTKIFVKHYGLISPEKNEHLVVDCGHHIMKEHCYWPLVSDLNNVLTHHAVAHEFLNDNNLLDQWFKFLSLFQGMNVNQRELKAHVEFESNTYYAAFSAELEASATPMWALISHLKAADTLDKTKSVLNAAIQALQTWFILIGFSVGDEINPYQVSFHIPLHRCFASFLGQAVRQQGAKLDSLLPSEDTLKLLMMHPLQAQVAFHEILCNMWVRSGLQIKGQAMTYIQCHFCNSIVDADLFLLQLCAMKLDPDWFLTTVLQKGNLIRFHVWEWFTFHPNRNNTFLDTDKVMPMLEGALSFLTMLLSTHTNTGLTEEEVIRQEMVSRFLCMNDRTHSQLMDLIPDKCGETAQNKNFETILNQVNNVTLC